MGQEGQRRFLRQSGGILVDQEGLASLALVDLGGLGGLGLPALGVPGVQVGLVGLEGQCLGRR